MFKRFTFPKFMQNFVAIVRDLRWYERLIIIALLTIWLGSLWYWQNLAAPEEADDPAMTALFLNRQALLADKLTRLGLPVFGIWQRVGPLSDTLTLVAEPERNPSEDAVYALYYGGRSGWQPAPEYVDGYVNSLRVRSTDLPVPERTPTICLARTIQCPADTTITVYLGCDHGFVLWLNGVSLLISDSHAEMQPGQESVRLTLRKGANRLVWRIKLGLQPCRFFFQPDYGETRTESLLAELDREFPLSRERPTAYRDLAHVAATAVEDRYYRLTDIASPENAFIEGGGLGFLPDGRLAVSTRRGFVYLVDGATAPDPSHAQFTRIVSGLHEALGLHVAADGVTHVAERGGVTRLVDRDGDGEIDTFRNVCSDWGLSGDYHEYTLDLERDTLGNFYTSLSLPGQHSRKTEDPTALWRGWIVQITPDGTLVPWCFGLRSADGLGWNSAGDLFATDNQGQWVAASPLYHIRRNHFYGHPASRRWVDDSGSDEARRRAVQPPTPPAVWIPYEEFCMSATDVVCDTTGGRFGPFVDQLFVGDMMKGTIVRVALEKIQGEYQGACFLFRRGVGAVHRMTFGPDGRLYLARAARGWGGGGQGEGLARLEFSGVTPLEIRIVRLLKEGFELEFTGPLDASAVQLASEMRVEQYRYEYWEKYGSPKVDRVLLPIRNATLSADGRRLSVFVDGIKPKHVCHLSLPRFSGMDGQPLLHTDAFYTVNQLQADGPH